LPGMSNEQTPEPSPKTDWFEQWLDQYQKEQQEQAAHWRARGHQLDEEGWHDEERCRPCLETKAVVNDCRCGLCCTLLVEVGLEDARREPKIAEKGSPMYHPPELTASGKPELIGYLLNAEENGYACAFLDRQTNLCTIHETRPLV